MSTVVPRQEAGFSEREAREARRLTRRHWPIRRYRLGDEPSDDVSATMSPSQRLAMVWPLTVLSWRLGGREIPAYERRDAPGRVVRSMGAA